MINPCVASSSCACARRRPPSFRDLREARGDAGAKRNSAESPATRLPAAERAFVLLHHAGKEACDRPGARFAAARICAEATGCVCAIVDEPPRPGPRARNFADLRLHQQETCARFFRRADHDTMALANSRCDRAPHARASKRRSSSSARRFRFSCLLFRARERPAARN